MHFTHPVLQFVSNTFLLSLFFHHSRRRTSKYISIHRRNPRRYEPLIRQLPRKLGNLRVILLPLWDLPCARKLGLFLENIVNE